MTIFCYVCKRHVTINAATEKDAIQLFHASGHDNSKVRQLRRGPVGK